MSEKKFPMDKDKKTFFEALLNNIEKRKYMLVHVSLLYRGEEDNTRSECQLECIKNAILEERRSIKGGIVPVCSGGTGSHPVSIFCSLSYSFCPLLYSEERLHRSSKRTFPTKKREINSGFERIKGNDRHSNRVFFHVLCIYVR